MIDGAKLVKRCLFCESPLQGKRTREHIFPKWLLKYMGIGKLPVVSLHRVRTETEVETRDARNAAPLARTEGRVCGVCNHGWMSALESQAMPVLKPFIEGTGNLYGCSGEDAAIIGPMGC